MTSRNETPAQYESPTLTTVGTLADLTQAHATVSNHLDAAYAGGTPTSELTYS